VGSLSALNSILYPDFTDSDPTILISPLNLFCSFALSVQNLFCSFALSVQNLFCEGLIFVPNLFCSFALSVPVILRHPISLYHLTSGRFFERTGNHHLNDNQVPATQSLSRDKSIINNYF